MGKDKKKINKNRKKYGNFFIPFFVTFSLVVGLGMVMILLVKSGKTMENADDRYRNFMVVSEQIPVSTVEEKKAFVEQIIQENDRYTQELEDSEFLQKNRVYATNTASDDEIRMTFAGDILFDENYSVMNTLRANGSDISKCIKYEVLDVMRSADICMVNNEFPYSDRGEPLEGKKFTFRAKPESVNFLHEMGVDAVSLANNHAYDHGETALLDTLSILEQSGIVYVGAGESKEEAQKPIYYIANNMKIAIVAATQIEKGDYPDTKAATTDHAGVFRCWDNTEYLDKIREAKQNSDFVICYIHWGTENSESTDWAQDEQMPQMVEAGADLIIGDHPHCLQKISYYKGVPVVYSLGNFWFNSKTLDTGLLNVTIDRDGISSLQFVPCMQSGCMTTLLNGEEKKRVLQYLRDISPEINIDEQGYITNKTS